MARSTKTKIVHEGKHIRMASRDGWEYATRPKATGIVGIIAVTDAREILLIEQYRLPLNATVIEIPAGLAGDIAGSEGEPLVEAAKRELREETGYTARRMKQVAAGASSAGITDEIITLFLATGLKKIEEAKGDGGEQITSKLVPLDKVEGWLKRQQRAGKQVDLKVFGALYFAR